MRWAKFKVEVVSRQVATRVQFAHPVPSRAKACSAQFKITFSATATSASTCIKRVFSGVLLGRDSGGIVKSQENERVDVYRITRLLDSSKPQLW